MTYTTGSIVLRCGKFRVKKTKDGFAVFGPTGFLAEAATLTEAECIMRTAFNERFEHCYGGR